MAKFKKGLISTDLQNMELKIDLGSFFGADDPVREIRELVDSLDIGAIEAYYQSIGQRAYPPRVMLRIIFYGYTQGLRSGKRLSEACRVDIRFIYLAEGLRPSKSTINDFRCHHHVHFKDLFKQVVQRSIELGITGGSRIYHDGSKIRANASAKRGKNKKQYEKWLAYLEADLEELHQEVAQQFTDPTGRDKDQNTDEPTTEQKQLKKKERLAEKIRRAKKELEKDPDQESRLNLTDPDAVFMKGKKNYKDTFYNVQASVSEQQLILHNDVCTSSSDKHQLEVAIEGVEHNTARAVKEAILDAGYSSFDNEQYLEQRGTLGFIPDQDFGKSFKDRPFHRSHFKFHPGPDYYTCPQGRRLLFWRHKKEKGFHWKVYRGEDCQNCPVQQQCTKAKARTIARETRQELRDQMRQRLQSDYGHQLYAKRKYLIEPVFGHLFRNLGYTYFLLRGLNKVKAEFNLMCTAYNLMKIAKHLAKKATKERAEAFIQAASAVIFRLKSIFQRTFVFNNPKSYIFKII